MSKNTNLKTAKKNKNDEFYTRYEDIEKEMKFYTDYLKGKWVYSSCDDYRFSQFKNYFVNNFHTLGLKHFTCTNYDIGEGAYRYDYDGQNEVITPLNGDGDFRSEECIEYLKQADVVVTNPPFSLFRQYVKQLMDYNKKFIIIGNNNALTYKDIFQLIKENKLWLGINSNKTMEFSLPMSYEKWDRIEGNRKYGKVPAISWFTNVPYVYERKPLILTKSYYDNPSAYPKFDNFDAINVDKVADIPMDYDEVMAVPITFLKNYCPSQFTIIDGCNRYLILDTFKVNENIKQFRKEATDVNGKPKYFRVLIKKKDGLTPIPAQFEIVGWSRHNDLDMDGGYWIGGCNDATINGKIVYRRILISRR